MKTFAALAALITLVAIAGACQATVSSTQLTVGECFNYVNTTDANEDQVNLPSPVDCSKPHSDEVFSVFEYPNASGFPGYEQIGAIQQTQCETDFQTYVGTSWENSSYTISYDAPDEQTWAGGDHQIRCLLEDANGGQLTGSARGTKK
jgi:hypothetical protein